MKDNALSIELENHDEILQSLMQKDILKNKQVSHLLARYVVMYLQKVNKTNLCQYIHDEDCDVHAYRHIEMHTRPGRSGSWDWRAKEACIQNINTYPKGSLNWSVNIICATILQIICEDDILTISAYDMVKLMCKEYPGYKPFSFIPIIGDKYRRLSEGTVICKTALAIELKEIISQEIKKAA
jgi:hypothetical protein